MKCKDCNRCSQRGSQQYFFCDYDNSLISADDYYNGKKMDCIENQIEDGRFTEDYIMYQIARK